jgi:serine protease Do
MTMGTPPPGQGSCHVCGTPLQPGIRFCSSCGAPVAYAATPPPPGQYSAPPSGGMPWYKKGPVIIALALIVVGGAVVAVFALKGGGKAETTTTTRVAVSTSSSTSTSEGSTTSGAPAGLITDVSEVQGAVVQIVAEGTFVDPAAGAQANVAGAGTGFIIDPSGLTVTANHVVTGSALLKVYFPGDPDPKNARVVGVSECSDLAVIDIEGDGFPYLEWYGGDVTTGLAIFAAGYPLGDPEFTLTEGIVSKADADGETNWASIDAVIEHSARSLPGNSGGPLVTQDAKVVGIVYAGNDVGQGFAISKDVAVPVVDQISQGADLDSIGVNGEAMMPADTPGIWVYSVKSGSPADIAGIKGGDLITRLENFDLAVDGTMSSYCDILRSHTPSDTLGVEVLRAATGEAWSGQINGRPMTLAFTFGTGDGGNPPPDSGTTYTEYTTVTDDSGMLSVSVPMEWADTVGTPWNFDGADVGPGVGAAPDWAAYQGGWDVPGVFIGASETLGVGVQGLLDASDFSSSCTYDSRQPYDDGLYVGEYDTWSSCGGGDTLLYTVAAQPADGSYLIVAQIQVVTAADQEAASEIIRTFQATGLGGGGGGTAYEYTTVTDDSGSITMEVPTAWADVDGSSWSDQGGEWGPGLSAVADRVDWEDTSTNAPGVFVGASTTIGMTPTEYLDDPAMDMSGVCSTYGGRAVYDDGVYQGLEDRWNDCGAAGSTWIEVAAEPSDGSFLVILSATVVTDQDWEALQKVYDTFMVSL